MKTSKQYIEGLAKMKPMVFACGLSSAYGAKQMPSGTFFPDVTFCNAGKYYSGTTLHHEYELLQDIAGGLCATIPGEDDYRHPVLGPFLRKYLKGATEIPVDDRVKCFYLIEDLTVSKTAGFWAAAAVHGGGSPEMERKAILADYDLEAKKALAKRLARIS
jgi:aromatic ring hydroxylase